jgi:hypothetical protein
MHYNIIQYLSFSQLFKNILKDIHKVEDKNVDIFNSRHVKIITEEKIGLARLSTAKTLPSSQDKIMDAFFFLLASLKF